jgi:putative PEP-CTERM system TPR-repeat lipoprotein
VAAGRLEAGQIDAAANDLQAAIDLNPDSTEARILLVLADLRRKDIDNALATTMALKSKMPGSPIPDNLLGAIEFARGNRAAAHSRFEDALKIAPDFLPSQMNLAALELADGQIDAARQRYDAIVRANPTKAAPAMLALAQIDMRQGKPDQAEALLMQAVTTAPAAVAPRVALVDFYLGRQRVSDAGAAALVLQQIGADNLQAQDAVLRTQIAAGDTTSALATLRRMTTFAPTDAGLQDRLARMLLSSGDEVGARAAFDAAINLDEAYLPAQLARLSLEVRAGRVAEALTAANEWRSRHPGKAAGDVLVGATLASAGRYDDAAVAYAAAVAKEATTENVIRQYDATLKAGKAREAIDGMTSWVDRHPEDQFARFSLANALLQTRRYPEARAQYELLVEKDRENSVILNNLAWLYASQGDSRAIDYAERAYRLSPNSPDIADTLGFILIGKGDTERGLKLLTQAHDRSPNSAETTYHLAVALKNAGREEEARILLSQLLASADPFEGRPEAETLKKELDAH